MDGRGHPRFELVHLAQALAPLLRKTHTWNKSTATGNFLTPLGRTAVDFPLAHNWTLKFGVVETESIEVLDWCRVIVWERNRPSFDLSLFYFFLFLSLSPLSSVIVE